MSKNINDDNHSSLKTGLGNKIRNFFKEKKGELSCLLIILGSILLIYLYVVIGKYLSGTAFMDIVITISGICIVLFGLYYFGILIYFTIKEAKPSNGLSCLFFFVFIACLMILDLLFKKCGVD